jgi:hypothetical protein
VRRIAARRAAALLDADVEAFERAGCRRLERRSRFETVIDAPRAGPLVVRVDPEGRYFGGNWALEVSTATPVVAPTPHGLSARGRGVVRQQGVSFRARRTSDPAAVALAAALGADPGLGEALGRVHFERVSVRPDGCAAIRHLGGSVVWVLFPPVVRATPLPDGQPAAMIAALEAFRRSGETAPPP